MYDYAAALINFEIPKRAAGSGILLLSKYPLDYQFKLFENPTDDEEWAASKGSLSARIQVQGGPTLHVGMTHAWTNAGGDSCDNISDLALRTGSGAGTLFEEARDLVEPAFIRFDGEDGEMRFVAVVAWLDVRYGARSGSPIAEFSWEGVDKAINARDADGSRSEPPDASSATSSSTTATIPVSSANVGEKFNSLLECPARRLRPDAVEPKRMKYTKLVR